MNKTIERQIKEIYNRVFKQVYSKKNTRALASGNRIGVLQAIASIESSSKYDEFAKKFAIELAKSGLRYQKGIWRKFYEASKKLHNVAIPNTYKEYKYQQMSKAVKHNFEMIKSIPRKTVEVMEHKYTSTLIEQVTKGSLPRGSFQRELEKHGSKNAKLIARTETAKLQTEIAKNRAIDLGSVAYIWLSSNDRRTRPSHKAMNGVVVFWRDDMTEKPLLDNMNGDAGGFPNCRCAPQPIVDPEEQLTASYYKVYDYHTHKIVNMTKKKLLENITRGSLE